MRSTLLNSLRGKKRDEMSNQPGGIKPTSADIGRAVVFTAANGKQETGTVVFFNHEFVFVRLTGAEAAMAAKRQDLQWMEGTKMKVTTETKKLVEFSADDVDEILRARAAQALNCRPEDLKSVEDKWPAGVAYTYVSLTAPANGGKTDGN